MVYQSIGDVDLAKHLRGPGTGCRPGSKRQWGSRVSGSNTNAHSEGGGITSCQILRGPDADSLAVLLNASHRDAKGFVERGMEPEISYPCAVKSKNSPWAQQGALVPDGGQHHACAAAQAGPRGRADRRGCGGRRGGNGVVG